MGWYVLRRIAVLIPVFLGATLLIYGMVFLLPGDPVAALGGDRPVTPAVAAQLRAQYHLDDPFLVQYLRYLAGILHGDFGRSYSGLPVKDVLAQAFPVTFRLTLIALTVEALMGIGFGVLAGLRQGGIFDAALARAESAPTLPQSYALTNDAQRILLHDMPSIPLWDTVSVAGRSPAVSNVVITWNGLPDYERIVKA